MVSRPVPADWLGIRRAADHQARQSTVELIDRLNQWLTDQLAPDQAVTVIDLGAGTGSNQSWLAPRLQVPQHWILLDHDAGLLKEIAAPEASQVVNTTHVVGSVDQLPHLIPPQTPTLVTCAALLDLLTQQEAELIADAIAASGAAALLSLTVTGEVSLSPEDPTDQTIAAAFDAHQRRGELLGPDAVEVLRSHLQRRGVTVRTVPTDWVLDSSQPEFVHRYLTDRVQAAVEYEPALADEADRWLDRRAQQSAHGGLGLRVGHQDLVTIPGDSVTVSAD